MLMPKRVKFRKSHRGRIRGRASRGDRLSFGDYGLQALEPGWITAREIEAGRVAVMHHTGSVGRLTIRIFPHKPVTKKPAETRMGTGKGEPEFWVAEVKPGVMMFELGGVTEEVARTSFTRVAHKLSLRSRFVKRGTVIA
ncbi:MAG: 50S ribosomal protein L16 [Planctomycetes bacterium]|nr:50S ribosomal protein L16 [Planctomycetota bacterium]